MTEPLAPKQRARDDGGWWVWFTTLFTSGDSSPQPHQHQNPGDGGIETTHHDSAHAGDSGADAGSDGGGGDGGGGGD